jgi:hypothetical protein
MSEQYVVILTGGSRPDQETREADGADLAVARSVYAAEGLDAALAAAFRGGYKRAAFEYRTVAAWVVGDEEEAQRFAEFVTREIDPAYVTAARSPLAELLAAIEPAACKAHPDDCPNGPEPHLYVPADSDRLVLCCHQPGEGDWS